MDQVHPWTPGSTLTILEAVGEQERCSPTWVPSRENHIKDSPHQSVYLERDPILEIRVFGDASQRERAPSAPSSSHSTPTTAISFIYESTAKTSNRAAQIVVTLQPVAKWSTGALRRLENCNFRSSREATRIRSWEQPPSELFVFSFFFFF